jgi:hypothetical protein
MFCCFSYRILLRDLFSHSSLRLYQRPL